MPVTDPGTRSPGKIVLLYNNGLNDHLIGANFVGEVFPSDISDIRTEAEAFAAVVAHLLLPSGFVNAWRVTDPVGGNLYEESFDPPVEGTTTPDPDLLISQSFSLTSTGKGQAPSFGVKKGNTRTVLFPGYYNPANWGETYIDASSDNYDDAIVDFLGDSTLIGADFYGQKATYKQLYLVQVNAHWQKNYGI